MLDAKSRSQVRVEVFEAADKFSTSICSKCGQISEVNVELGYKFCRLCNSSNDINEVDLAYTTKLLSHELAALGVRVNFHQ